MPLSNVLTPGGFGMKLWLGWIYVYLGYIRTHERRISFASQILGSELSKDYHYYVVNHCRVHHPDAEAGHPFLKKYIMWSIWHSRNKWKHEEEHILSSRWKLLGKRWLSWNFPDNNRFCLDMGGDRLMMAVLRITRMVRWTPRMATVGQVASQDPLSASWSMEQAFTRDHGSVDRQEYVYARGRYLCQASRSQACDNGDGLSRDCESLEQSPQLSFDCGSYLIRNWKLASTFIVFSIQHIIRSANYLAHLCAKRASTLGVSESWVTGTPSFWLAAF
jgi:hypothetical protein